eukprot:1160010-Pelagomonas_calceolata.AAC.9
MRACPARLCKAFKQKQHIGTKTCDGHAGCVPGTNTHKKQGNHLQTRTQKQLVTKADTMQPFWNADAMQAHRAACMTAKRNWHCSSE